LISGVLPIASTTSLLMFICGESCQSVANLATTLECDQQKWKPVLRPIVQRELF
jgi:hypothetical protein